MREDETKTWGEGGGQRCWGEGRGAGVFPCIVLTFI